MKFALAASVFFAAVMLCALTVLPPRVCFSGGKNHRFICGSSSADCFEYQTGKFCEAERLAVKDVCGESAEYDDFDLDSFLRSVQGKVLFCERAENTVNYYCSAKLPYSVYIKGYTVNLQICLRENGAKVGTPIIFGGY